MKRLLEDADAGELERALLSSVDLDRPSLDARSRARRAVGEGDAAVALDPPEPERARLRPIAIFGAVAVAAALVAMVGSRHSRDEASPRPSSELAPPEAPTTPRSAASVADAGGLEGILTPEQIACMLRAKTQAEVEKCMPRQPP